ncbi:kinesin, putative [Plasmodium gallinaceum]|uniref:Kinesin, putative n=1 Tax=Plasmodium gallinaceum TaxID=5849 RepID=A0A1J1H0M6_PLAGA|nr:kinesin, putative [Plasmodium gallinaceum]CRG97082.1 kinesin, putative [Plasmodium gallinaceum]
MVNKISKNTLNNPILPNSKIRNTSKGNKTCKTKEVQKDLYQWYIDNNIEDKKKKNINIEKNTDEYYEDVEISKNVEEYINVLCRIKNDLKSEKTDENNLDVIKKVSYNKLVIDTFQMGNKGSVNFEYTYDRVYDIENNNQMIFNDYIKNNIKNIFQGINCSILAYGQTNSGKTYTMLGNFEFLNNLFNICVENKNNKASNSKISITYDELTNCITNEPNNVGLIPHCINYIFNYINYHKKKNTTVKSNKKEFTVTLSILEIYNEIIYDLISGESNLSVQMIDSHKNEFVIKNLKEVEIENIINALYYLEQGVNNRKIAFTHMNKASSRSHLIFIIKINRFIYSTNTMRCGKLCLVDLAGSERLKQTKATGSIKIETTMINKSLTVLSKVINSLAVMQIKEKMDKNNREKTHNECDNNEENDDHIIDECNSTNIPKQISNTTKKAKCDGSATTNVHIPYRDSKLTRVLSDSLGNNCKSILICTLSSQLQYLNETASTIKFAQRAKMVKAKPVIREEKIESKKEDDEGENDKISNIDNENNTTDKKLNIFCNFNSNNINKDIIFFCFSLCIFSYMCGFKSTGKTKYLDFFIESYKNKIDIIKQQLNKETENNDINEYILKTFDDLKVLTEEEKAKFNKINEEKLKNNKEISSIINNKTGDKLHNTDKKKENKEQENNDNEDRNKLTVDYLNKINNFNNKVIEEKSDLDGDNLTRTNVSKDDIIDEDDALIGDILIKMKNDICNILKFNLTSLKNNMKEDEKMFDEIINIVNTVKENNSIFLLSELNENKNDVNLDNKDVLNEKKVLFNESDNNCIEANNIPKNKKDLKIIKDIEAKKKIKKEKANVNTKSILNLEDHNEKKMSKSKLENICKNNNNNHVIDYVNFAEKILSVTNIQNIFDYVNNNFSKFISDFTTDKSTVFTNFDLNENIDRQVIEKNNTIYNFIHAATMFQPSGTLKNLNSNYFINKIQTEIYNNYNNQNFNLRGVKSINNIENLKTDNDEIKNNCSTNENCIKSKNYKSIKGIETSNMLQENQKSSALNKNVKFSNKDETNNNLEIIKKSNNIEKSVSFYNNEDIYEYSNNNNNENDNISKKVIINDEQIKKGKLQRRKESNIKNINVSQNEQILEFTRLLENKDFKKLYDYLIEKEDKHGTNIFQKENDNINNVLQKLESKINDEIKKINENITVDISNNNRKLDKPYKKIKMIEGGNAVSLKTKNINNSSLCNSNHVTKKFDNIEISYLEKKRNTNLCIKKIFNIIKNIFHKKDIRDSIEINVTDLIDNEFAHNKKLLEKNLDSYNIRNFHINNKKIYILNETEYAHLRELINYKNKMLSFLNSEYKKCKLIV